GGCWPVRDPRQDLQLSPTDQSNLQHSLRMQQSSIHLSEVNGFTQKQNQYLNLHRVTDGIHQNSTQIAHPHFNSSTFSKLVSPQVNHMIPKSPSLEFTLGRPGWQ
ncbi:hypothetical protein KI387_015939, partial [Taxus chinensis]